MAVVTAVITEKNMLIMLVYLEMYILYVWRYLDARTWYHCMGDRIV